MGRNGSLTGCNLGRVRKEERKSPNSRPFQAFELQTIPSPAVQHDPQEWCRGNQQEPIWKPAMTGLWDGFEGYLGSTAEICFSTILPQPLRQTYTRTFSMPVSGSIEGSCFAVSALQGFTSTALGHQVGGRGWRRKRASQIKTSSGTRRSPQLA